MKSVQDILDEWRHYIKKEPLTDEFVIPSSDLRELIAYFDDLDSFERMLSYAPKNPNRFP